MKMRKKEVKSKKVKKNRGGKGAKKGGNEKRK